MKRLIYFIFFVTVTPFIIGCQVVDVIFNAGAVSGVILISILSICIIYMLVKILVKRRKKVDRIKD